MQDKIKRLNAAILFLILIMMLLSLVSNSRPNVTCAVDEIQYSNVLVDLKKDKSFKKEIYVENNSDYNLRVIQIAESVDNELFLYTYQPSANTRKYIGTCVNMSVNGADTQLYDLEYLNSEGLLFKYKIVGVTVDKELEERTYDITSIYRPFDSKVDTPPEDEASTITEVSYTVGKLFKAKENEEGETVYDCTDTEVIKITDKFVGFVRYKDGYHLSPTYTACDSHFIAFDTDKDIEDLYEAKVTFSKQTVSKVGLVTQFSSIQSDTSDLTCTDKVEYNGQLGWVHYSYKWDRVQTIDEFIQENSKENIYDAGIFNVETKASINDSAMALLRNKKWILRFTETEYLQGEYSVAGSQRFYTNIGDVSVIELTFKSEGKVFKVGVVDNKQTGSGKPVNAFEEILSIQDGWIKWIFIIAIIVGILLLVYIFKKPLKEIFGMVFKAVWWVLTLPFEIFKD